MTSLVSFLLALFGLVVSAQIRIRGVLFGQPFSVPVLGLAAVVVVLVLAVMILVLLRCILRDGWQLRPRTVSP